MRSRYRRRAGAGLAVAAGAVALAVLSGSPAMASTLFCGAGRGPTAEVAVWSALDDARNSAQSVGLYGECTIVGQPVVAQSNDPLRGLIWRASLNATCLP